MPKETEKSTNRENLSKDLSTSNRKLLLEQDCNTSKERFFKWADANTNGSQDCCRIVIDGKVYDLTRWKKHHPGGELVLMNASCIKDATDYFRANHSPSIEKSFLKHFYVGRVIDYEVSPATKEFREMVSKMEMSGWYKTDFSYYAKLGVWYLALLTAAIISIVIYQATLIGAFFLGFFFQQIAFLGHDLGHNAVFHDIKWDAGLGIICGNLLSGISIGWWKASHNVHHLATNALDADPDVQHMPAFAVDKRIVDMQKPIRSTFHNRVIQYDFIASLLIPYQHFLYYIIMGFARWNLYAQGILLLFSTEVIRNIKGVKARSSEFIALLGFFVWLSYLTSFLPTWFARFTFLFLSHALAGILHVQITLSHFSMPTHLLHDEAKDCNRIPEGVPEFVHQQLSTSLDLDCPWWLDWVHGGLQWQSTHHLFPRSPRHKNRELVAKVKVFCQKYGIQYNECGFFEANCKVVRKLKDVAFDATPFLRHLAYAVG